MKIKSNAPKSEGLALLQKLATDGVKFFCLAGANGSGKDLQADLAEILLMKCAYMRIAHVSTSSAIKHHMQDEGRLGEELRVARENEKEGILFPDQPTIEAVTRDVNELHTRKYLNSFILSGVPRGKEQPGLLASLPNCEFLVFHIGLATAIERAFLRTEQRKIKGLPPRPDDHIPVVRSRWHEHEKVTLPAILKAGKKFGVSVKLIDGNQPVKAVLCDVLKAMKTPSLVIDDCLSCFERREGEIAKIMEGVVDKHAPIPQHWPITKKIQAITERVATARSAQKEPGQIWRINGYSPGPGYKELFLRGEVSSSTVAA